MQVWLRSLCSDNERIQTSRYFSFVHWTLVRQKENKTRYDMELEKKETNGSIRSKDQIQKEKKGKILHLRERRKKITFSIVLLIVINTGCFRCGSSSNGLSSEAHGISSERTHTVYVWRNVYDLDKSCLVLGNKQKLWQSKSLWRFVKDRKDVG